MSGTQLVFDEDINAVLLAHEEKIAGAKYAGEAFHALTAARACLDFAQHLGIVHEGEVAEWPKRFQRAWESVYRAVDLQGSPSPEEGESINDVIERTGKYPPHFVQGWKEGFEESALFGMTCANMMLREARLQGNEYLVEVALRHVRYLRERYLHFGCDADLIGAYEVDPKESAP